MGWESVTLGQMWLPMAGAGVIVMALGSYFKLLHPWIKEGAQFLRDWAGIKARPGYAAVPGFPERMQVMEQSSAATKEAVEDMKEAVAGMQRIVSDIQHAVQDIQYQVKPNGGNSAYDHMKKAVVASGPEPDPETPGATLLPPAPGAEAP